MVQVRVELPYHLRNLAGLSDEVVIALEGPATQRSLLDALEARYPMLRGTIRDHQTKLRRPYLRFYANEQDLSHESLDAPLPDAVISGREPFLVIGAMSGGEFKRVRGFRQGSGLLGFEGSGVQEGSRVQGSSGSKVLGFGGSWVRWLTGSFGSTWGYLAPAVLLVGCGASEPQVPAALRERLHQETRLTDAELGQVRLEVGRRVGDRAIRLTEGGTSRVLDAEERRGVLEVVTLDAGVFDEGVRREGTTTFRVLNGPARSTNAEIEASQRLWVDADTLLPRRYEFAYAFPGVGEDRVYELTIER